MNDEKGRIIYHSKSPEKVRSVLEEKKRKNKELNRKKRRPLFFLSLTVLIVAVFFFSYYLYMLNSKTVEYIGKSGNAVVRIVAEDTFLYGDVLNISIKLSNSSSHELEVSISDFEFRITDSKGENEYGFKYPPEIKVNMDRYDSRDVFSFARENPYFSLPPDEYSIECKLKIDGNIINMNKTFAVVEHSGVEFMYFDDYITPGAELESYIRIKNFSPETKTFTFGNYSIKFIDGEKEFTGLKADMENASYTLRPDERVDIPLIPISVPNEEGIYTMIYTYFMNGELKDGKKEITVHKTTENIDFDKLRILPYSLKVMGEDKSYEAEFYMVNDSDYPVYETVERVFFSISKNSQELFRYASDQYRKLNVLIPPYSKRIFFSSTEWRKIDLPEPGEYSVKITLYLKNKQLEYEETLTVLPSTGE